MPRVTEKLYFRFGTVLLGIFSPSYSYFINLTTGLYTICQKSGIPWILCKSITSWSGGSSEVSEWQKFGAAASASYVEHVLRKFYIPETFEGKLAL